MTEIIARYHFAISKDDFLKKRRGGHFNGFYRDLNIQKVTPTVERFIPLVQKVGGPWGWDHKAINRDHAVLQQRLNLPETKLFYLLDGVKTIGYSIVTKPPQKIIKAMPKTFIPNSKVIEIENLGLFPGQEGNGRGGKFFEILFETLFKEYDYIYWNMSSTNYSGLYNYYTNKLQIEHIGTDYIEDFRPAHLRAPQKIAA